MLTRLDVVKLTISKYMALIVKAELLLVELLSSSAINHILKILYVSVQPKGKYYENI